MTMKGHAFSLVLAPPFEPTLEWNAFREHHAIITLTSLPLLRAALDTAEQRGVEVSRVILDQTATSDDFLAFLSSLPSVERADILLIRPTGDAYLSSVTPHDGRVIYHLESRDVKFYLEMHFAAEQMRLAS